MNTRNLRFRSNRVADIVGLFHQELDGMYGRGEVDAFCAILFEAFLGWDRVRLMADRQRTIDQSDLLRFHWALEDLRRHRPVQHIVGYVDFCGCRLEVGPDVLIPRPETEEMVSALITTNYQLLTTNCLDLCTGSGCIAIALKRAWPEATVVGIDLSERALAVARRNAERNGVDVDFRQGDVLDPGFAIPEGRYSLIVSNPPYVRQSEQAFMAPNVLNYEPHEALFVPDADPLRFYAAAAAVAERCLAEEGVLALEINEALAAETCALLAQRGFRAEVHTDFRGKERWLTASR